MTKTRPQDCPTRTSLLNFFSTVIETHWSRFRPRFARIQLNRVYISFVRLPSTYVVFIETSELSVHVVRESHTSDYEQIGIHRFFREQTFHSPCYDLLVSCTIRGVDYILFVFTKYGHFETNVFVTVSGMIWGTTKLVFVLRVYTRQHDGELKNAVRWDFRCNVDGRIAETKSVSRTTSSERWKPNAGRRDAHTNITNTSFSCRASENNTRIVLHAISRTRARIKNIQRVHTATAWRTGQAGDKRLPSVRP